VDATPIGDNGGRGAAKLAASAPLCFQPTRKRLMAREEGNRASCPLDPMKPSVFFEFPSKGVTNIDTNRMPLVHYIGQFIAGKVVLFHRDIVPFCANARENNPRRGPAGKGFSVCVPERNTVRVLHCDSSLHCEAFVATLCAKQTSSLLTFDEVKSINIKVQVPDGCLSELS